MKRRRILATLGTSILLAGCTSSDNLSSGTTEKGSADTSTTATANSCSVAEDSPFVSLSIPPNLTEETAQSFAIDAEESYAISRAREQNWTVAGTDSTRAEVESTNNGFYVKARISLDGVKQTEVRDGTEQPIYGDLVYEGWYRITPSRAERAPGTDGITPPEDGWKTLACK